MPPDTSFQRAAIRPIQCLTESWAFIKDDYWMFFAVAFVGTLLGGFVPLGIILGPILCGIYLCFLRRESHGENADFEKLFKGFDVFVDGMIPELIKQLVITVMMFVLVGGLFGAALFSAFGKIAEPGGQEAFMGVYFSMIGTLMLIAPLLAVFQVLFVFCPLLIMDRGLKGMESVKVSFAAVKANFGGLIGLALLQVIVSMVAFMLCVIPSFLLIPIVLGSNFVAYRKVFPATPDSAPVA